MEVHCEGCAGCCIDWRPVTPPEDAGDDEVADAAPESPARRPPLDDTYNLVPMRRDEVRDLVADGLGDALVPRLFAPTEGDNVVRVDGHDLAAIDGRPVFHVGLRTAPKPVGAFGLEPRWLDTCAFLDPETLQCRVHGDDHYPETCATYPGTNLVLGQETECERVEAAHGGDRLLDDDPPADATPPLGPQALGATLFAHPDPDRLEGTVARLASGDSTLADRADFVGVAVGTRPGSTEVDADRAAAAEERALAADSWIGRAVSEWAYRAGATGSDAPAPGPLSEAVEAARGAPDTPGW